MVNESRNIKEVVNNYLARVTEDIEFISEDMTDIQFEEFKKELFSNFESYIQNNIS